MFTGLIEAVGRVIALKEEGNQALLTLDVAFASELKLGDSVAINGCCLTVSDLDDAHVSFDLLAQTLKVTSLGDLVEGDFVNLERAVGAGDRFDGHFVQGHVDATGQVLNLAQDGQDHILTISLPEEIKHLVVDKGSIALEGISLTIAELEDACMTFWITPHTWEYTHLDFTEIGDRVNLEADLIAKHLLRLVETRKGLPNLPNID